MDNNNPKSKDLLIIDYLRNQMKDSLNFHLDIDFLVGMIRDSEGHMQQMRSPSNNFYSVRDMMRLGSFIFDQLSWDNESEKQIIEVPLYLHIKDGIETRITEDYGLFPDHLKHTIENGLLMTYNQGVPTDYSVMMCTSVQKKGETPTGRTGFLLYKGKPVIVNIDGKDFILETKGIGRPDGVLDLDSTMKRSVNGTSGTMIVGYSGKVDTDIEYDYLEAHRQKSLDFFVEGESPRSGAMQSFGPLGILYRLSPSSVRTSFQGNPAFDDKTDFDKLASDIGHQWATLARDLGQYHYNIHPENIINTGTGYSLTDFADIETFNELYEAGLTKPVIERIFNGFRQLSGLTKEAESIFYMTISNELGLDWKPVTGFDGFINSVWSGYFCPQIYEYKRGNTSIAKTRIDSFDSYIHDFDDKGIENRFYYSDPIVYLENEIRVLQHIDDPIAKESVDIAQERIKYLQSFKGNIQPLVYMHENNHDEYASLFVLPYMTEPA